MHSDLRGPGKTFSITFEFGSFEKDWKPGQRKFDRKRTRVLPVSGFLAKLRDDR